MAYRFINIIIVFILLPKTHPSFTILLTLFIHKHKTAHVLEACYWSSDVCSSDLLRGVAAAPLRELGEHPTAGGSVNVMKGKDRRA